MHFFPRLRLHSFLPLLALLLAGGSTAFAHPGHESASGLLPGALHPLTGLDHLLAMVAVGIWAAQIGGRARWIVPASFVGAMLVGGALGMFGVALPMAEQGIVASLFVLGLCIALAVRPPLAATAVLVGLFAICHGYAHGLEAPENASGFAYAAGFALMTAALHGCGILLGILAQKRLGTLPVRLAGMAIFAFGFLFAVAPVSAASLDKPLKEVVGPYLAITASLAADSFKDVPKNAEALNKAVQANAKQFPPALATEAAALAQAKDIKTARTALKPLSASLISFLAAQKVQTGSIHEAVCPMEGSWLQADKTVHNPYDASMPGCGDIKRTF